MKFAEYCKSLEQKIKDSYEAGVTMEEAEKLAGEFLYAQLQVSSELKKRDLDRRMKKSGAKAVRSAMRLNILKDAEGKGKKPTEGTIDAMLDTEDMVQNSQDEFDAAEVDKEELERVFDIFKNAHIHFRGISKGKFE